jgi:regulator of sirC expression with transglutaminase-like and TPR domain
VCLVNSLARTPLCFQKEKWARCVEVCNTALSHEPGTCKALLRRAKAFLALREADAARRDLDAVQAQCPNDQDAGALRRDLARLDAELAVQEATLWRKAFDKSNLGA